MALSLVSHSSNELPPSRNVGDLVIGPLCHALATVVNILKSHPHQAEYLDLRDTIRQALRTIYKGLHHPLEKMCFKAVAFSVDYRGRLRNRGAISVGVAPLTRAYVTYAAELVGGSIGSRLIAVRKISREELHLTWAEELILICQAVGFGAFRDALRSGFSQDHFGLSEIYNRLLRAAVKDPTAGAQTDDVVVQLKRTIADRDAARSARRAAGWVVNGDGRRVRRAREPASSVLHAHAAAAVHFMASHNPEAEAAAVDKLLEAEPDDLMGGEKEHEEIVIFSGEEEDLLREPNRKKVKAPKSGRRVARSGPINQARRAPVKQLDDGSDSDVSIDMERLANNARVREGQLMLAVYGEEATNPASILTVEREEIVEAELKEDSLI